MGLVRRCAGSQKLKAFTLGLMLLVPGLLLARTASAETLLSPSESEDAAVRAELQRIEKEIPASAAAARDSLDALNESTTSARGRQARNRRERGARRIVNGIQTVRHSAVAAILRGSEPETAGPWCTGTLVGCNKILTAAHCINKDPNPKGYLAYFPMLGFFKISKIAWQPDKYNNQYADLAMLTLEKSIEGVAPVGLNTSTSPINGAVATIVGYGRSGGTRYDYGIKREGSVKFSKCTGTFTDKKLLCWNFDADVNVSMADANTCNVDSGGGVFMQDNVGNRSVQRVVGVVAGGRDKNCVKDDQSYNTDVFAWRDWLYEVGEAQLTDQLCGRTKPVDLPANIRTAVVSLDKDNQEVAFEIEVPDGTRSLRIAMNGEDDTKGTTDFDLMVFKAADRSEALCKQNGKGQFAFCEVDNPDPGTLLILVNRKSGAGLAQLTVTLVDRN